ncbi:MAG: response regulator [Burkholderiaceae bacterium]|nr:response regulator [Burkholderiaceae bacterium]
MLGRVFAEYVRYHEHGRPALRYFGIASAVAHPVLYGLNLLRSTQPYDSLEMRLLATALSLMLALQPYWPVPWRRYSAIFSYVALLYCLPFYFIFVALKNEGGPVSLANTLMAMFFLILLTDWRNTILMQLGGTLLGVAAYFATTPHPVMPVDYIERFPVFVLVMVGGSLFKLSEMRTDATRIRSNYRALAGSVAHEMRHPLTQIQNCMQTMENLVPAPDDARQALMLAPAQLGDVYQQLERGAMAVQACQQVIAITLAEVASQSISTRNFVYLQAGTCTQAAIDSYGYASQAERWRVQVRVVKDFCFQGEETIYTLVLHNLLRNALYYFALYPQATVTLIVDAPVVRVRDTGPGIPQPVLEGLFESFSSTGKPGGTGLGLAYCRRAMRAFGGDIGCESQLGAYTEFLLRFPEVPLHVLELHQRAAFESVAQALRGKRVLVVDDDDMARSLVRRSLEKLGASTEAAEDGRRALAALASASYDIVVMDLNMPVMDGYSTARAIRASGLVGAALPIIACSSESGYLTKVRVRNAGINGLVSKAAPELEFLRALQNACEKAVGARHTRSPEEVLTGKTILLADDSAMSRMFIKALLEQKGACVIEADHGKSVLEQLDAGLAVDALVIDISMPGMTGFELAARIRAGRSPLCDVPLLALTGYSDEANIEAARVSGIDALMTKPVDSHLLYETLAHHLAVRLPAGGTAAAGPDEPDSGIDEQPDAFLLNPQKIEQLDRIELLDEFVELYRPRSIELLRNLRSVSGTRTDEALRTQLHMLLGLCADVGARQMHERLKELYRLVDENMWPPHEPDWLDQLDRINAATIHALKEAVEHQVKS